MINMLKKVMEEIKGPEPKVRIAHTDGGMTTVTVSFDASKIPCLVKEGSPDKNIWFRGQSSFSPERAEQNTVLKVTAYLKTQFGIQIVDSSYARFTNTIMKCQEVRLQIEQMVDNTTSILKKWKSSISHLNSLQKYLEQSENNFHMDVSGKVKDLKIDTAASLEHISNKMMVLQHEHANYCNKLEEQIDEDAIEIKIPEKEILNEILVSTGFKEAKFSTSLEQEDMFRGKCKINLSNNVNKKTSGKIIIQGDAKKTTYEAECSAAASAISYLERSMSLEIVDLNYNHFMEKKEELISLQGVRVKCVAIASSAATDWRIMINKLKDVINSQHEYYSYLDTFHYIQKMQGTLDDITILYDLSTIVLEEDT